MGSQQSYLSEEELHDYQMLTFLSRKEILEVLERFIQLTKSQNERSAITALYLSRNRALKIKELYENPFRDRIVDVFSSQSDGSLSFEDFLDMMSVFSEHAPKSVKVSYAFKIYQGIGKKSRPDDQTVLPNTIDLFDIKEIIRRLSGKKFNGAELTQIAEAVIKEVDIRGDKTISGEIFEYFLSNVPDFPSSFVIQLAKGDKQSTPI